MQSSSQIITTNKPTSVFFTGWTPFLSPNQQLQSTEGKNITFHGLAYPSSPGVFQLCLWPLIAPGYLGGGLPLAMPLISPLTSVAHWSHKTVTTEQTPGNRHLFCGSQSLCAHRNNTLTLTLTPKPNVMWSRFPPKSNGFYQLSIEFCENHVSSFLCNPANKHEKKLANKTKQTWMNT